MRALFGGELRPEREVPGGELRPEREVPGGLVGLPFADAFRSNGDVPVAIVPGERQPCSGDRGVEAGRPSRPSGATADRTLYVCLSTPTHAVARIQRLISGPWS